jgi:hypothetical protein
MPRPTVTLDVSEVTSPRIRRLHAYWQQQRDRRNGCLPKRGDIAPDEIKDLLPNIMIVDVERDPLRFRYRLVGTRVVEYNGFEFTGRYLGEIGWPEEQDLIASYTAVVDSRQPFFGLLRWELVAGAMGRCEFVRLPLGGDDETVSQILAMEDYDFPQPDGLPSGGDITR